MSPTPLSRAIAALLAVTPGVSAQEWFAELPRAGLPAQLDSTLAFALADVDGDGDQDAFVVFLASYPGRAVELLLNDGRGRFTATTGTGRMPNLANTAVAVAVGDIDGDGDPDLAIANRDHVLNRLYRNDGTGTFSDAPTSLPADTDDSRTVAFGDADGDGDLDLAFGNAGGPALLHLNDGSGTFSAARSLPTRSTDTPAALRFVDVDGDTDVDLTYANSSGPARLLINDGTGNYTDQTNGKLPGLAGTTTSIAVSDVDGDGDPDLVLADFGSSDRLYVNDGTGTFADASAARLPADVRSTRGVVALDADGDGDDDLVFVDFGQPNRLCINDGTGHFARAPLGALPGPDDHTNGAVIGDVDGDGRDDVLLANGRSMFTPSRSRLLLGDGAGGFVDATATAWPLTDTNTRALAVGDVDGDAFPDVVVGIARGQNELLLNDGFGGLARATAGRLPSCVDDTRALAMADVDGDGDRDLLCGNRGQSRLFLNDGTGRFLDVTDTHLPFDSAWTTAVRLGDVDGDGDLDAALANAGATPQFAQQNRLWLNDGSGHFTDATPTALPSRPDFSFGLALTDVDGDGDLDMVVANWSVNVPPNPPQPNRLLHNDGSGVFSEAALPADTDPSTAVVAADIDQDGDADLVFANFGAAVTVYLGDGAGSFTLRRDLTPGSVGSSRAIVAADVELDGDLDLVVGNFDQQNFLLMNDGTGAFWNAPQRLPQLRDVTLALAMEDLDADGDLDLLVGNDSLQTDRLHKNLLRQVEAPRLPALGDVYQLVAYSRPRGWWTPSAAVFWISDTQLSPRLPLPPFGSFGLDPIRAVELPTIALSGTTGSGALSIPVPVAAPLMGATLFIQGIVYPLNNPFGARLTNVLRDVVRR